MNRSRARRPITSTPGFRNLVKSGPVAVTLKNEGEELHEIGLLRLNDGVTLTAEQLFMLPEEEGRKMATPAGFVFAAVGQSATSFLDLEPGKYVIGCFVPVGSKQGVEDAQGPPHFTEGMAADLTVT